MSLPLVLVLIVMAAFVSANLRIVQEGERLVVFRLGRYHRVLGPGLHMVLAGVDRPLRVSLNALVRNWQSLSEEDLVAQLEHLARTGQLVSRG